MALTNEQVENWRKVVLPFVLGPWASLMPDADIERFVNGLQDYIDADDEHEKRRTATNTYHEDRASVTVAEDRAMKAREAARAAREDRLSSLTSRVVDALE